MIWKLFYVDLLWENENKAKGTFFSCLYLQL